MEVDPLTQSAQPDLEAGDAGVLEVESATSVEIDPETIPEGRQELDPRWIPAEQMASRIFAMVLGLGAALALLFLNVFEVMGREMRVGAIGLWLILIPTIAILGHCWPKWEYPFCGWRLTEQSLDVWKGLLGRREIRVPRTRVQYTDVTQGPVQRKFGLGSLQVHVAGTEDATITVPGLPHSLALRLRDELLEDTHDGDAV
ncbi:MAG: PH domain-containing protein [Planctomycetes bacterium]|nr:PH domain-containing protein [Planctomycetota bacterium]